MQEFIGSVRRSLVFKPLGEDSAGSSNGRNSNGLNGFVEKIGFSIRNSRIGLFKQPFPALPDAETVKSRKDDKPSPIRWRKGELIGSGAFGRVYMGMNLDSGELLAIKEVSIAAKCASKEKTKIQIRELEEEVNLLKNLSHPNIVRYLGTAREEESLNILLEFVPGGSISSLLGKFGSFPEPVIRMYTKQLLLGLDYLHRNGIMHRDIKGANILVDNKGCIKLADFGASKKVVELATMTGAKSMKGTPYWMAPEVILQTGHTFSADIWSVGCTVIEMATGKPPWSQQYQEVAALFHIGTTKSHPPIPDHLSEAAKDFLLKCLQKEPYMRSTASDLLEHPFVTGGGYKDTDTGFPQSNVVRSSYKDITGNQVPPSTLDLKQSINLQATYGTKDASYMCSTIYPDEFSGKGSVWKSSNFDDDMCQIDDKDELMLESKMKFNSHLRSVDCNKSFNPMSEPDDEWSCKFDGSPQLEERNGTNMSSTSTKFPEDVAWISGKDGSSGFTFPATEDDDDVTEMKIMEFLAEKAVELKKLQSPLFEEFYNTLNTASQISPVGAGNKENISDNLNLPPKSKSPIRVFSKRFSKDVDINHTSSPGSCSKRSSNASGLNHLTPEKTQPSKPKEFEELLFKSPRDKTNDSSSFSERQKKWKEELVEELDRKRELLRQAGVGKVSSPKDRILHKYTDQLGYASPRR